ncbi:DNA mismatch repair endonuclease MutL [Aestuariivirga sp.]|uniref:DNA mismatch repair endonuclease MutL n=1 Tax=Aestuariivirga sp. TaxID=2650926 RepID=UPI0039E320C0
MRIRRLPEGTINRIAAGEVIERPASAVKELVENAIDAGASRIEVVFRGGGKSLIRVSDDGFGMTAEELALALERHATSKLPDDDLSTIRTMGFRGEALPSIASIARFSLASRARGAAEAFSIAVEGGSTPELRPAALKSGTEAEVRDIFYATPARLKFLKTDRSETAEALDVVRRLALANPAVGFSFVSEERRWLDCPPGEDRAARVVRIMDASFMENAVPVAREGEDVVIEGFAGLPTAARAQATQQFAFVNGRPVRDKLISGAIRGAYADVLPPGRHPAVVLYITCAAERVDVNVHPAKTEVRFRDQGFVRGLIVSAIRAALGTTRPVADTGISAATLDSFRRERSGFSATPPPRSSASYGGQPQFAEAVQTGLDMHMPPSAREQDTSAPEPAADYPLGQARAQLHGNYIVAQTPTGLILVDQHAAHERIVYERLKAEHAARGVITQPLLVPQVIDVDGQTFAAVLSVQDMLAKAGLAVEGFGDTSLVIREVPAALASADWKEVLQAVADEVTELGTLQSVDGKLNHVLATFACHHSVRSGRTLRVDEMNALLRQMEVTPNAGQCNHGRPTFIELKMGDIERLFGRS